MKYLYAIFISLLLILSLSCAPAHQKAPTSQAPSAAARQQQTQYDLPIEVNRDVKKQIDKFTSSERVSFAESLARYSTIGMEIRRILAQRGAPQDLVFVAMIESRFHPRAVSHSGAVGVWQFMKPTALEYGLRIDTYVDDRKNWVRATHAAATYLTSSYSRLRDWPLAMASYNAGLGGVLSAMKKSGAKDYWGLIRSRHIKAETKAYVPRVYAAAIIAKNPERYGFSPGVPKGVSMETVSVQWPLPLSVAAKMLHIPETRLVELNPHLIRKITPPGESSYPLIVPGGMGKLLQNALQNTSPHPSWYRSYKVRRGDTITSIARDHRIPLAAVLSLNPGVSASKLKKGDVLSIALPPKGKIHLIADRHLRGTETQAPPPPVIKAKEARRPQNGPLHPQRSRIDTGISFHIVKKGESLWSIARKYNTKSARIREMNKMKSDVVRTGQKLLIPLPRAADPSQKMVIHSVVKTDTLWGIAKKYDVSLEKILEWNNLKRSTPIWVGMRLQIILNRD